MLCVGSPSKIEGDRGGAYRLIFMILGTLNYMSIIIVARERSCHGGGVVAARAQGSHRLRQRLPRRESRDDELPRGKALRWRQQHLTTATKGYFY